MDQVDFDQIEESIQSNSKTNRRGKYKQYSDKDRFIIGKYASENGPAAAVSKFKKDFGNINESNVRGFCKRYEKEIEQAKKDQSNHFSYSKARSTIDARKVRLLSLTIHFCWQ